MDWRWWIDFDGLTLMDWLWWIDFDWLTLIGYHIPFHWLSPLSFAYSLRLFTFVVFSACVFCVCVVSVSFRSTQEAVLVNLRTLACRSLSFKVRLTRNNSYTYTLILQKKYYILRSICIYVLLHSHWLIDWLTCMPIPLLQRCVNVTIGRRYKLSFTVLNHPNLSYRIFSHCVCSLSYPIHYPNPSYLTLSSLIVYVMSLRSHWMTMTTSQTERISRATHKRQG